MSMQPRRRQILRVMGTACLATGTSVSFAAPASSRATGRDPMPLIGDQWVAAVDAESAALLIDTSFEFWSVHGRAAATLTDVNVLSTPRQLNRGTAIDAFELVFTITESTRNLPRELCNVLHPQLGGFELFVQSGNSDKGLAQFVACFTRSGKFA